MKASNLSPVLFFDTLNGYQRSAALQGAIELGIFTAIGKGNTAREIARKCAASERGARILCDYLVVQGFLEKSNDQYRNTPASAAFLSKDSPQYLGGATQFLLSNGMRQAFRDVAACVRSGGTVLPGEGTVDPEDPIWVDFAEGMMPLMMPAALELAELLPFPKDQQLRVLDIAAGHGVFGLMIAKRFAQAHITALDWPQVLKVAKDNAKKFEVLDRFQTLPGSAFEVDFGKDYDVVLLTNFLHHFDLQTCETLLKKIERSLRPGGYIITLEFIPNEYRVSPPPSAAFSMVMLCTTRSGDAYTFSELNDIMKRAGFSKSEVRDINGGMQQVLISKR